VRKVRDTGAQVHIIEVSEDWLEMLRHAIIPLRDGGFLRLARVEPLVNSGRERLTFVQVDTVEYEPGMLGSDWFSDN
jgi:hypothetical protein